MDNPIKKETSKKEFSCIEELIMEYKKYEDKYSLPEFYELNKSFDIEEIDTETQFFLRKIRRLISERVTSYMRFIEIILNPSNAPMFFFKLLKKLDSKDRELLLGLYESLGNFEIDIISLDLDYSEEKEAEFIKRIYKTFNEEVRNNLMDVIKKLGDIKDDTRKDSNGSYFG
jgi:hypothetical protein